MLDIDDITKSEDLSSAGNRVAPEALFNLIYKDLKAIAHYRLKGEWHNHTLQTTALVHEAFLRLNGDSMASAKDRNHLMALVSRVMRHILVDHARAKKAAKRAHIDKSGREDREVDASLAIIDPALNIEVLDLDRALTKLNDQHPRLVNVVECRFFAGMTALETAEVLSVCERTIERDWYRAKVYLYKILNSKDASAQAAKQMI